MNRCNTLGQGLKGSDGAGAENHTTESVRQWRERPHRTAANYKIPTKKKKKKKKAFQAGLLGFVKQARYHLRCFMIMNIDFSFNFKHFASLLDRGGQHRCAGDPEVKESAGSYYNTNSRRL